MLYSFDDRPNAHKFAIYEWRVCECPIAFQRRHVFVVTHHGVCVGGMPSWRHSFGVEFSQGLEMSEDVGQLSAHGLHFVIVYAKRGETGDVFDIIDRQDF